MAKEVVLMRHLKDEDNLLIGGNDAGLLTVELPKARIAATALLKNYEDRNYSQIVVLSSSKKRAIDTAGQVRGELRKDFSVTFEVDCRMRELDQGDYLLPGDYKPGDYFQPLQDAWLVFFKETFTEGNLQYRFGDPISEGNGRYKYPELSGHFRAYGENQIEFSIRLYNFVIDICEKFRSQDNILPIVVTHQAMIARFAELTNIAQKVKSGKLGDITLGTLPLLEWQQLEEIKGDGNIFVEFGGTTTFPLCDLYDFTDVLKLETSYLESIRDRQ